VRDIGFLPEDPQLRSASWSGEQVSGGRFYRASKRLARDLVTR
jgi:hypothetical protein